MHNPIELPRIYGRWHWLEIADSRRAAALGYNDPIEATMARSRRELGSGIDGNTPNVIFVPHRAHLNPDQQPEGDGYWSYVTVFEPGSARALAWVQLGGQEEYGFGDVRFPRAHQVWELRLRMITEGRSIDVLDGIDLAWVEESFIPNPYTDTARPSVTSTAHNDPELVDPDPPHLPHDVTNAGEHDQTGSADLHTWRTREIKGIRYTLDVSTAIPGRREPHKFEIVNDKGWRRYQTADNMDWNNKTDVKRLNAWRDQALSRGGWPRKREEERESYTEDQRRWVFGLVSENGGKPPNCDKLKDIAEEFNRRFNARRTASAMSALAARLSMMYKNNDGQFVESKKRGQKKKKKKEAAKKRKERESSEEVMPVPKRRRKPVKQEAGVGEEARAQEADDENSDESMLSRPAEGEEGNGNAFTEDGDGDVAMTGVGEETVGGGNPENKRDGRVSTDADAESEKVNEEDHPARGVQ